MRLSWILPGVEVVKDITWIESCQGYDLDTILLKIIPGGKIVKNNYRKGCQGLIGEKVIPFF